MNVLRNNCRLPEAPAQAEALLYGAGQWRAGIDIDISAIASERVYRVQRVR